MSGLRVIAGKARGRKLQVVPGDITRPITDRVKEALFNIIGGDVVKASFLDLFAGTGSVGIEALSRGAANVRFVDIHHKAIQTIRANIKQTGLEEGADIRRMDALKLVESKPDCEFDYVYIAPPQYKGLWIRTIQKLDAHPAWLADDAWVVVQIHPVEYESLELINLIEIEQRKYGSTLLIIYNFVCDQEEKSN